MPNALRANASAMRTLLCAGLFVVVFCADSFADEARENTSAYRPLGERLLRQAHQAANAHDIETAHELAMAAARLGIEWRPEEVSPQEFLALLRAGKLAGAQSATEIRNVSAQHVASASPQREPPEFTGQPLTSVWAPAETENLGSSSRPAHHQILPDLGTHTGGRFRDPDRRNQVSRPADSTDVPETDTGADGCILAVGQPIPAGTGAESEFMSVDEARPSASRQYVTTQKNANGHWDSPLFVFASGVIAAAIVGLLTRMLPVMARHLVNAPAARSWLASRLIGRSRPRSGAHTNPTRRSRKSPEFVSGVLQANSQLRNSLPPVHNH